MKNLIQLYNKSSIRVLGLMSGTSLDGLDIADICFESKESFPKMRFYRYFFIPYKKEMQKEILTTIQNQNTKQMTRLHYKLGNFFADSILEYIQNHSLQNKIELIASHGQTIYHQGAVCTLQIGEADIIARKTSLPVIFDFRALDIANGNQGAPLIPYFDQYLQALQKTKILFLNLGGIANFSIIHNQKKIFGDTGPANILLNLLVTWKTKGALSYDKDGLLAKQGKINNKLLQELLRHPFIALKLPKSTGHEDFGMEFLQEILKNYDELDWKDILRTLTFFSATTIATACSPYLKENTMIVVSGGGLHNPVLMEDLKKEFAAFKIKSFTEIFGFPADAKEAVAFAYFAYQKFQENSNIPSFGKIAYTNNRSTTSSLS